MEHSWSLEQPLLGFESLAAHMIDPNTFIKRGRPEDKIRAEIRHYLELKGWYVKFTHGSAYQSGFPDIYATHKLHGARWIEVKLPGMKRSKFTPAQLKEFPKFQANGASIWVLTAATDYEYSKLFQPSNLVQALEGFF